MSYTNGCLQFTNYGTKIKNYLNRYKTLFLYKVFFHLVHKCAMLSAVVILVGRSPEFVGFGANLKQWTSCWLILDTALSLVQVSSTMDSSTICQCPPHAAYILWSCDTVYHKQEVCFLLYFLGQIVSWQYNTNLLDSNWPCTVIYDHVWQLWNCPLTRVWNPSVSRLR